MSDAIILIGALVDPVAWLLLFVIIFFIAFWTWLNKND